MAGSIRELLDGAEQLDEYRDLSPNNNVIEGAFIATEARFIAGAAQVEREVERRRELDPDQGGWRDPETVRRALAGFSDEQQREQFRTVRDQLLADVARIPMGYHDMLLLGMGSRPIIEAMKDVAISLHSPVVQESLLLPVAEPWRDEVTAALDEFAALLWGFLETLTLDRGPNHQVYLEYLADHWEVEDELLAEYLADFAAEVQAQEPDIDIGQAGGTGD